MKKSTGRNVLALTLTLVLATTLFPVSAFADDYQVLSTSPSSVELEYPDYAKLEKLFNKYSLTFIDDGRMTRGKDCREYYPFLYTRKEGDKYQNVSWSRLKGQTALDTMAEIVKVGWSRSDVAVLATSRSYQDALSGSALAGAYSAPMLITDGKATTLSSQTKSQITRLGVKQVYIVGGKNAVSEAIEAQVSSMGIAVKRLKGQHASDTAVAIAGEIGSARSKTCIVATSHSFQDALSASPYAYKYKVPIYLADSKGTALSDATLSAIRSGGYTRILVVGGRKAVTEGVEAKLKGIAPVKRIKGATAVDTSMEFASFAMGEGMSDKKLAVATSKSFQDALVGGALCGKNNSVVLLTNSSEVAKGTKLTGKDKLSIGSAYVLGGRAAVPAAVGEKFEDSTNSVWDGDYFDYKMYTFKKTVPVGVYIEFDDVLCTTVARNDFATDEEYNNAVKVMGEWLDVHAVNDIQVTQEHQGRPTFPTPDWYYKLGLYARSSACIPGYASFNPSKSYNDMYEYEATVDVWCWSMKGWDGKIVWQDESGTIHNLYKPE